MNAACLHCNNIFLISEDDVSFLARISPSIEGVVYTIPPPRLCPSCRLQRRLAFRNQIHLFNRTCSKTKKPIVSMWSEDAPFPVYKNDVWWGDAWDALDFGQEISFNEPFFAQIEKLKNRVPHFALSALNTENSDYCNNVGASTVGIKNSYLIFNTLGNEDCLYGEGIPYSRDCIDCSFSRHSEMCYDCTWCHHCYNLQSSECCEGCRESFFLLNCVSCENCFGCANLRHARFCIFNQQYSREEYFQKISSFKLSSYKHREHIRSEVAEFFKNHPRPHQWTRSVEHSSGNYISHSKEVTNSFFCDNGDRLKYCLNLVENCHDCRDYSVFGFEAELMYECVSSGLRALNCQFCSDCWEGVRDLMYCILCSSSSNCFGCVGLRKKEYCILNKQYSSNEYFELIPKIIAHMDRTGEWGEFFPMKLAGLPYNRSYAQRYFPLTESVAHERNLLWYSKHTVSPEGAIPAELLPDDLPAEDRPITVLSKNSSQPFRITSEELRRYRALSAPLPRLSYDERMDARANQLSGVTLYTRACDKTGIPLQSAYSQNCGFPVWDRDVYVKEFGS